MQRSVATLVKDFLRFLLQVGLRRRGEVGQRVTDWLERVVVYHLMVVPVRQLVQLEHLLPVDEFDDPVDVLGGGFLERMLFEVVLAEVLELLVEAWLGLHQLAALLLGYPLISLLLEATHLHLEDGAEGARVGFDFAVG